MRRRTALALVALALVVAVEPAMAQDVTEPGSGVKFAAKKGDLSLLGVGLRTRTILQVKVYAIGLYVADGALTGPLAAHKATPTGPALYRDLVRGDFPKELHLKFVRDVGQASIQEAMRASLAGADKTRFVPSPATFPRSRRARSASCAGCRAGRSRP